MNPEKEFDIRIADIYGVDGSNTTTQQTPGMDMRHAEFQAMAEAFLGKDYDSAKLEEVEDLQVNLRRQQALLLQRYESGELAPETYVDSVNDLLASTLERCEQILGRTDFEKLFGASPSELAGFIDKETFLSTHRQDSQRRVVAVQLDADVPRWLEETAAQRHLQYQTLINEILAKEMRNVG